MRTPQYAPMPGELIKDKVTGATGVYMETWCGRVYLRPARGGVEMRCKPENVLPAPGKLRGPQHP
ncbi:hypothetical protein [Kitasatospora sp. McL0602]|uniref:hypothetical protein n=1 Tax=Kitasatospora sp. McL0602 TaxID=3439530 RepID=UPI003F8C093C